LSFLFLQLLKLDTSNLAHLVDYDMCIIYLFISLYLYSYLYYLCPSVDVTTSQRDHDQGHVTFF